MTRELRPDLLTATVEAPTLLDVHDLAGLMRCDKGTVLRMVQRGEFPRPLANVGMRGFRWLTSDYLAWLAERTPHG